MAQTKAQLLGPVVGDVTIDTNTLSLDSDDNRVGIGTASATTKLHVKETINTAYSLANVTDDPKNLLKLENASTTANAFSGLHFRVGGGADMFFGAIQQSVNHGDFYFANQNSPNAELMRIKSNGNVGIGDADPNYRLVVTGQDQAVMIRQGNGALSALTNNTSQKLWFQGGNAELGLFSDSSGNLEYILGTWQSVTHIPLVFRTGNRAERMRITFDGKVGIGTVAPGALLHLESTAANAARLRIGFDSPRYYDIFRGSTTNSGYLNFYGSQSSYVGYTFGGVDGEWMRIKTDGKVGIGTIAPEAPLHVYSTAYPTATITRDHTVNYPRLRLNNASNNGGDIDGIGDGSPAGGLRFATVTGGSSTIRMTLNGNGRVNIGLASDVDHTLCVAGTDNTTGLTGGHSQGIQLQNKSTTDGTYSQIEWRTAGGGRYARIAGIQDDANGNGGQLVFLTEESGGTTTERLRITSDGKIGLSDSNPTRRLSVNGSINIASGERIESYSSGGNLIIQGGSTYPGGHIKMWGGTSDDMITFNTSGGSASSIERMRITSGGLVDVSGGIHVTENVTPTSGRGVEIFEASAGVGQISSFNRDANSWDELRLKGSEISMYAGGVRKIYVQSSSTSIAGTTDGVLNIDTTDSRGSFIRFKENGSTKAWVGCAEGIGTLGDQDDLGLRAVDKIIMKPGGNAIYLGPYDAPGSYTNASNNVPYKIKVAPYGWQHHSDIAEISMGSHYGTGQDDGQIIFKTAQNVHSDTTGLVERLRITADGILYVNGSGTSGGTSNAAYTPVRIQGNNAATLGADVRVRGGSTGYTHSSLSLQSTSSGNPSGGSRGLGVFMYDEVSDVEWYAGRPYSGNDYYMVTRDSSIAYGSSSGQTAQHGKKVMALDNARRMSTSGREYHFSDRLYNTTHKTSRIITSRGKQGTLTSCTVVINCHSYGTLAYDISVGGYSNAGYARKGTLYMNGAIYSHFNSLNTSMGSVSHTFQYQSSQKIELVFSKNGGFVHPICSVDVSFGGDGYFDPGDVSITWS